MGVSLTSRVEFSGPLFQRDPKKTVRQNIRAMLDDLAREAQQDVQNQIAARAGSMPAYTGHSRDHIRGRVESVAPPGKRWTLNMVVSPNTTGMSRAEAIRTMAALAGRHEQGGSHGVARGIEERWHPFRRTAFRIRRMRAVLSANLTKGLE